MFEASLSYMTLCFEKITNLIREDQTFRCPGNEPVCAWEKLCLCGKDTQVSALPLAGSNHRSPGAQKLHFLHRPHQKGKGHCHCRCSGTSMFSGSQLGSAGQARPGQCLDSHTALHQLKISCQVPSKPICGIASFSPSPSSSAPFSLCPGAPSA